MTSISEFLLLDPAVMTRIDAAAGQSGIPLYDLMERAGQAVAASALRHYPQTLRFVVLCGSGNNGGDGYVAARALARTGGNASAAARNLGISRATFHRKLGARATEGRDLSQN